MYRYVVADVPAELLRNVRIAHGEQELFGIHRGNGCQNHLALIRLADPSPAGELLQQARALSVRVRPVQRQPGEARQSEDQADDYSDEDLHGSFIPVRRPICRPARAAKHTVPRLRWLT